MDKQHDITREIEIRLLQLEQDFEVQAKSEIEKICSKTLSRLALADLKKTKK